MGNTKFILSSEPSNQNPTVNSLLGLDIELFKHCCLQLGEWPDVTFAIEPYDRDLTEEDMKHIISLLKKYKEQIIDRLFLVTYDGISIIDYVFNGAFDDYIE